MKKSDLARIIREEVTKVLNESTSGKTIMCVDIQPEYQKGIYFDIFEWIEYISSVAETNNVILLYNGPEVGGMDTNEYAYWLIEQGMDEDVLNSIIIVEKDYGFFRDAMDSGYDEEDIVSIIEYLITHDMSGADALTDEQWSEIKLHDPEIIDFIKQDNRISIPSVLEDLDVYDNILLMGGGQDQCLREIELLLQALGKQYTLNNKFVY